MGRRRYQQPSVLKTKAARPQWYFRARVDVLMGPGITERRERFYYLGFCDDMGKRKAEKQRDAILSEAINKPQLLIQSQIKFSDVIAAYKREHIPNLREVSQRSYCNKIEKWIESGLGSLRMCDITPQVIQAWVNGLPKATSIRKSLVQQFDLIWRKARAWGYTQTSTPAEFVSVGARKTVYAKVIPTQEQYARMRAALSDPQKDMADVAVTMGLRVSEIRGLPVRSVDLAGGCVRIEQRLDSLGNLDDPKSIRSRRVLPMGALKAMFARRIAGKLPDDLVFEGCGCYETCQDLLRAAAEVAGFVSVGFGWHSLRRCHNTWFRKSGASVEDAMGQLGHSTSQVNDLYLVQEGDDYKRRERAVLKLQEQLLGTPTGGVQ